MTQSIYVARSLINEQCAELCSIETRQSTVLGEVLCRECVLNLVMSHSRNTNDDVAVSDC